MKEIPDKFVMERRGHKDVRSLQKYQRLEVSTKVQFPKVFDCATPLDIKKPDLEKVARGQSTKKVFESDGESRLGKTFCCGEVKGGKKNTVVFQNCTFVIQKHFNVE